MRCGRTFRLARTHPAHVRSSGSETLSRSRSLADYTIDTHESEFSEAAGFFRGLWPAARGWRSKWGDATLGPGFAAPPPPPPQPQELLGPGFLSRSASHLGPA